MKRLELTIGGNELTSRLIGVALCGFYAFVTAILVTKLFCGG